MKNFKIVSLILVLVLSSAIFAGCNLVVGPVSASMVYNKYIEIVNDYTIRDGQDINAEESLFNANQNLIITYKADSNFSYEINQRPNSVFNVFSEQYPETLYSALNLFNFYRNSLNNQNNEWDASKIKDMYDKLLTFQDKIKDFNTQKKALENLSIVYNEETSTYPYTTLIRLEEFRETYNALINSTLAFVKVFEKSYREDVINSNSFLTEAQVPYYEVRRVAYTANLYMAEAGYYYYVNYESGFESDAAMLHTDLYNSMVELNTTLDAANFFDSNFISNVNIINFYRNTRQYENQVLAQSSVFVNAIKAAINLQNSQEQDDVILYNDYSSVIHETVANYRNYSSFVVELLSQITDVV